MKTARDYAGHYTIRAYGLEFTAELVDSSDPEPWELRQVGSLADTDGRFRTLRDCKHRVANMTAKEIQWCRQRIAR